MAVSNLLWSMASWCLDHLCSELSNNIQNLLEIARYSLTRSSESAVNHSESLVMTDNMKKHCHLLFNGGVDAIFQPPPGPKRLHKLAKRSSAHSEHVHGLDLVVVVDVVQIRNPLLVSAEQWTIPDYTPVIAAYCSMKD